MKKAFTKALLALSFLCTGTLVTSCDSETLTQLFPLISNLFNTGETYLFSGSGTSRLYTINGDKTTELNAYQYDMQVQLECTEMGTLTTQALSTQESSEISITNLSLTPNDEQSYTILAPTNTSEITGTLTVDGRTLSAQTYELETAAATSEEIALKMIVNFGTDASTLTHRLELTFTGKTATE